MLQNDVRWAISHRRDKKQRQSAVCENPQCAFAQEQIQFSDT